MIYYTAWCLTHQSLRRRLLRTNQRQGVVARWYCSSWNCSTWTTEVNAVWGKICARARARRRRGSLASATPRPGCQKTPFLPEPGAGETRKSGKAHGGGRGEQKGSSIRPSVCRSGRRTAPRALFRFRFTHGNTRHKCHGTERSSARSGTFSHGVRRRHVRARSGADPR